MIKTLTVYCGSSDHVPEIYLDAARQMGESIARHGLRLAYGAGSTGLMGALADSVLQAGGEVVGVIPALFNTPRLAHQNLTELQVVESMHQRKARLVELGDAFVALPGGFGTLEEFFEILTWAQIGLHQKPIGLLNTRRYYQPLLELIQHAKAEGMIYSEHEALFVHEEMPEALIDALQSFQNPQGLERWRKRDP
jgi:uncharacterized protein (TIGR00730 family)